MKAFTEINAMLTAESGRLGVEVTGSLPDPVNLANDIVNLGTAELTWALNDPEGKREVGRAAMDIKKDAVEGIAELERGLGEFKERSGRMIEHAAGELGEAGLSVTQD